MTITKTPSPTVAFIQVPVTEYDVKGLLCSAFEQASFYWMHLGRIEYAPGLQHSDFVKGGILADDTFDHPAYIAPLTPNCAVIVIEQEGDEGKPVEHRLDRAAIERGIRAIVKYPHHVRSIAEDNCDADTGDVFLQLCLFNEIKYG